jgi:hypothetical protein
VDNAMRTAWAVGLMRALIGGSAVVMSLRANCPWPGGSGLGLFVALGVAGELTPSSLPTLGWKLALAIACAMSLLVPVTPPFAADENFTLEIDARYYHSVPNRCATDSSARESQECLPGASSRNALSRPRGHTGNCDSR